MTASIVKKRKSPKTGSHLMRKPYEKPALKFGEVSARKTDTDIMYGVKLNISKQQQAKLWATIEGAKFNDTFILNRNADGVCEVNDHPTGRNSDGME